MAPKNVSVPETAKKRSPGRPKSTEKTPEKAKRTPSDESKKSKASPVKKTSPALPRKVLATKASKKEVAKKKAPVKVPAKKAPKASPKKKETKKKAEAKKKVPLKGKVKKDTAESPKKSPAKSPKKSPTKSPAQSPKKSPAKSPKKAAEVKPTSKPLFGPHSKDLYGYWYGKWYEVEVLKEADRYEKGQHVYLIRWTKDPNLAKPGEWATNESYYPENWIFPKEDIAPHQLPGADKKKAAAPKKRPTPTKGKKAAASVAPRSVPAPAFGGAAGAGFGVFSASPTQSTVHKYAYKWQYFDNKRPSKGQTGWHDYDISGSDVVEEAYQSWVTNPYIDVRAVYSGHWNYMVDFNQMQQTNVDHADHTIRAIRRVRVDDETDAMEEQRTIRRQVSLQRISAQMDQINSADSSTSSAKPLERSASLRATADAAESQDQPAIGTLVRVPSGRSGIVLTNSGAPSLPVQVQFSNGETQFLDPKEVQKE